MRRTLGWVLTGLVALLLAACGTTTSSAAKPSRTPAPSLEPGWKLYPVTAEGFAIAIPPNWGRIDLTLSPSDVAAAFKDNPEFAKFLQQVQLNKYVKLFAVDNQTLGSGFATNLNVIEIPVPDTVTSLDQVVTAELATFQQLKITPTQQRVHLRVGDTEEFDYTLPVSTASGAKVSATVKQWVLLHLGAHPAEFVVTLTTRADQAATYDLTFGKIANTFRYL